MADGSWTAIGFKRQVRQGKIGPKPLTADPTMSEHRWNALSVHYESLNNLTPEDVYRGHGQAIFTERKKIKQATMQPRRALHRQAMVA